MLTPAENLTQSPPGRSLLHRQRVHRPGPARRTQAAMRTPLSRFLVPFCRLAASSVFIIAGEPCRSQEATGGSEVQIPAMNEKIGEQEHLLRPGYRVPETGRDPFFSAESQKPKGPDIPAAPSASNLLVFLEIAGLMGKPENPRAAGVLVGNKIYRVGDQVPVVAGRQVYSMTLVAVRLPDKVDFEYKGETATKTVGQKKTNGD